MLFSIVNVIEADFGRQEMFFVALDNLLATEQKIPIRYTGYAPEIYDR